MTEISTIWHDTDLDMYVDLYGSVDELGNVKYLGASIYKYYDADLERYVKNIQDTAEEYVKEIEPYAIVALEQEADRLASVQEPTRLQLQQDFFDRQYETDTHD